MIIYTAQVTSNMDPARAGYVQIFCQDEPRATEAIYTTPFYKAHTNGGFFAAPVENSNILIAFDPKTSKAYYLSTVMETVETFADNYKSEQSTKLRETPIIKDQQELYEGWGPASVILKNEEENGLRITDRNAKKYMVNETRLNNEGKILSLNSSPEIDSVLLDNGHGDYLKITGMPESAVGLPPEPKRSLQAKTFLSQEFTSDRGGIDIRVVEGKDITIENDSTGFMSLGGVGGIKSGNVNIFSRWKNVRLAAKGVLPLAPDFSGGKVILETAVSKTLLTNNGITLKTGRTPLNNSEIELDSNTGNIILKNRLSKIILSNVGITLQAGAASIQLNAITGGVTIVSVVPLQLVTPGLSTSIQSINFSSDAVNIGGNDTTEVNIRAAKVNIDGSTGVYLNTEPVALPNLFQLPSLPTPINAGIGAVSINSVLTSGPDVEYPKGTKYPV